MKVWKHIMNSCTQEELSDPTIMNTSRIERVSVGSGTTEREVRDMLKHHKQSKKMMKAFKGMGGSAMKGDGEMNEKEMKKAMRKMGNMKGMMKQMMQGKMR
jgi:signal recognition particle GTPase